MRLVDVLKDEPARRRFLNACPAALRRRMTQQHIGRREAVVACDRCVQLAWEWITGAIPRG